MPRFVRIVTVLVSLFLLAGTTGCVRPVPHVALPDVSLGEPSFFPTLEAYAGSPIVGGNAVEVLLNGEEIFPALVEAISSAQRTISYAQYFYEDGPVARDVAEALAERCRAGVGVNVLLDGFGTLSMPGEYVALMRTSGCHVVHFRPLGSLAFRKYTNRNHRRILVVDGRIGFTGGSGVSRKWMGNGRVEGHWRDTDVRVEGPVVEYLQAAFAENWLEATGMVLGGEGYFPGPLAAARQGLRASRAQLTGRGQLRDVHDPAPGPVLGPAIGLHHQPVSPARRQDAGDADRPGEARGARGRAGPRRHRPQHRATVEPRAVRRDDPGRDRDLRVHPGPAARQDRGDRWRVGHHRQHQLRQPIVRAATTS